MTKLTKIAVSLVAGVLLLGAVAAQAQGPFIGSEIAGAKALARAHEAACLKGKPPTQTEVESVTLWTTKIMAAYFKLNAKSGEHALGSVFAIDTDGVSWRDSKGEVSVEHLGDHLTPPAAAPVLVYAVVGGDGQSARELWTVTPSDPAAAPVAYFVEFGPEPNHWTLDYAGGVRIMHMSLMSPTEVPVKPPPFCNLTPPPAAAK